MTGVALSRTVPALAFAGLLALQLWSRTLSPWALLAAGGLVAVAGALAWRRFRAGAGQVPVILALVALGVGALAATATTVRLAQGSRSWTAVQEAREARLSARLEARMQGLVRRAASASESAALATLAAGGRPSFTEVESIRERTGVDALAVVDGSGRALAWAGDHRGQLPRAVVEADSGAVYPGGTLFSYLYAVTPAAEGLRAVSAVLVQAGPPVRGQTGSAAERFEAVTGERPRFGPGSPPAAVPAWTLEADGAPVLHARWASLSHGEWRGQVARTGLQVVLGLVILSLVLLSAGWLRALPDRTGPAGLVPLGALALTLMMAPLRGTLGVDRLFSPGFFLLPLPGDVVMEGVLVVLLPVAALVATLRPAAVRRAELWLRLAVGGALAGGGFAVGAGVMSASAGQPLLTSPGPLWYVLMPTTVVLLATLAAPLMPVARDPLGRRDSILFGAAAVALSLGLALGMASTWRPHGPPNTPVLLAWALPFVLLGRAVAGYAGGGERLVRWLAAGWLAASAVVPHLWIANQSAKLSAAETELASFGARTDPYLTYLLVRFDEELRAAQARGEQGGDLLYEAWVASGLASEPYPLEISLWNDRLDRVAHLPLGLRLPSGGRADLELMEILYGTVARHEPENIPAAGGGVSRFLTVPLENGAVSVAVAPRASLRPASALTAFMDGGVREGVRLELLPSEGAFWHMEDEGWHRTPDGWRREMVVQDGVDLYHAHLELRTPPAGVRFARAVLLAALGLAVLTLLWLAGRLARGDPPTPPGGWRVWPGGFRARLTIALFVFFLIPSAVYGWAAYRALAEEVSRAARQVAERAVTHASTLLPEIGLAETARRTGEDLLFYRGGALRLASMPEAQELGLYSAWMPAPLFRMMRMGEAIGGSDLGELAGRPYMVAYRRLPGPDDAVAVPIWLAGRDAAVRQREFAHLVLFGTLMGGLLSLVLSVLVGRALARPIGELRRASAAVGRGRLGVRLHDQRPDEFGELFASFNRMARRLRKARAQELRTARILAWGEMARQVAHEIKNPLTPIKLSVQHLRRAYQDGRSDYGEVLDSNVERILEEIERLTEIARAFSRYGAPQEAPGATEPVDVGQIARDVLTLYRAPDRAVRYRLSIDGDDTTAAARAAELREVLVNLLENARAAVGDAGTVDIAVRAEPRGVVLEVRDDGEGIPADQVARIFDPHFSTRTSGTGLGLAIVRRLVEGWGGEVVVESEPGRGTTMRVVIPRL